MKRARLIAALLAAALLSCKQREVPRLNPVVANRVTMRQVNLFFETPARLLGQELRNVALPDNEAAALATLVRELLLGSANQAVPRPFPPDAVLRGAFLLPDGTAVIDLGGATLVNGWSAGSHEELIAVFSLVQTLTSNIASVKRVRILIEGQSVDTLAGHVAIDRALAPMRSLVGGGFGVR